jgi:hypothetical protein
MKKIYFTYRRTWVNNTTRYDLSFYNDLQYADYKQAGLTEMIDGDRFVPDDKIIAEITTGIKSMRRAGMLYYNDMVDGTSLAQNLQNTSLNFATKIETMESMREWIRVNTSCKEVEEGKFLIAEASESPM